LADDRHFGYRQIANISVKYQSILMKFDKLMQIFTPKRGI